MRVLTNQFTLVRTGAVCAVLGTVVQVAAGMSASVRFGTLPAGAAAEVLLPILASQPPWVWTTVQLGFVLGPVFWVVAFFALASTLPQGVSGALAKLAATTIIVGAAIHIISSSVNGFGLSALTRAWEMTSSAERSNLVLMGNVLLSIINGTWASSITLFHGLPFVLSGLAVISNRSYPALLGWLGFAGGLGSLVAGPLLFFGVEGLPTGLSVISAVVISIYMLVLGFLLWNQLRREQ